MWSLEILSTVQRLGKGAAAGVAFACAAAQSSGPPTILAAADRSVAPNLILVVIDTLRRDHLGCYGYSRPTSPKLDAFAHDAALFDHCLAPSSWTEPSTASLLSGLYPPRHGCHEYAKLPDEVELLSEILTAHGYRTGGVSGNPNASPRFGFDQGFASFWFDAANKAREYPDVSELVAQADAFLAKADERPFFLYLHVMNVHGPYLVPEEWRERFREPGAADFPFQNELWKELLRKGGVARRSEVTPAHVRDLTNRYDAAIGYTDAVIGDFLARRRAAAGSNRDLVVVTADHGEELFDHGGFGHGFTLQHEVVDVPLLVQLPAAAADRVAGIRIDTPVSLVDLPATLLDLAALLPSSAAGRVGDGFSLAPLLRGATRGAAIERDAPLFAQLERDKQGSALLLQCWPLRWIETSFDYAGRHDVAELFDEVADPQERHDLLPADPERATRMRRALAGRLHALEAQGMKVGPAVLDAETRAQMAALGYGVGEQR